jgi:hypothetical protein
MVLQILGKSLKILRLDIIFLSWVSAVRQARLPRRGFHQRCSDAFFGFMAFLRDYGRKKPCSTVVLPASLFL